MASSRSFFAELKRRNVVRAAVLYAGAVWAFGQGLSQFSPALRLPDWTTRWFLVAAAIGLPFWLAFAWFYEFTPHGLKRESEVAPHESITRQTGRKLDFAIIGVLVVAVVLLLTNTFVWHEGAGLQVQSPQDTKAAFARIPEKSIAVLPLSNESGDKDQQYFSDGLSEDLINALSQFAGLKVISRNSSFQFRDSRDDAPIIGEKLGVAHLLEGSVHKLGGEVRISAELVNASDGSTLWSQHYDRPYKDLFQLQDDITRAVAAALKAKLFESGDAVVQSDRPPSGNLAAWQAYQQGNFYHLRNTEAGFLAAIAQFTAATRVDPRYAAAWAQLSRMWSGLAVQYLAGASQQRAYSQAGAAVQTALALDPNLASAHAARGYLLQNADFNWRGAQSEYRRAQQLAPNDVQVLFDLSNPDATLGRVQSAVTLTREALARDPLHASWYNWLSAYLSALGRLDEAEQAIRKAITLQPAADSFHLQLTVVAIQRGNTQAALTAARQESSGSWQRAALALATQMGKDRAAADGALQLLIEKDADQDPYQIAQAYALRHDSDNMFKWLNRAWAARDPGIAYLMYDPFVLRYQHDPRFIAFCGKVGLPTTTDAVAMK